MNINSNTKTICLLGHPIKQSFSPNLHNYLFEKYEKNNVYICYDVKSEDLEKSIEGIKSLGICGCNVTIPHKVDIIKYIDDLDEDAKLIGAINTIKNEGGKLVGYNTDGIGFVKSILDKGYKLKNKKVMILGAGGACRSIAIELAKKVKSIEIRNRSLEKANEIKNIIINKFDVKVECSDVAVKQVDLENIDIIINTTPIGMESEKCPIDENIRAKDILVCDIVYKPHDTKFLRWAQSNNLDIIHGIDMLINQALHAFYIWTNIKPTKEDEDILRNMYLKL